MVPAQLVVNAARRDAEQPRRLRLIVPRPALRSAASSSSFSQQASDSDRLSSRSATALRKLCAASSTGCPEQALAFAIGAGIRPAAVAEKFALGQAGIDGGAIDGDERFIAAFGVEPMDGTSGVAGILARTIAPYPWQ
jgi:hypothetical protein